MSELDKAMDGLSPWESACLAASISFERWHGRESQDGNPLDAAWIAGYVAAMADTSELRLAPSHAMSKADECTCPYCTWHREKPHWENYECTFRERMDDTEG